MDISKLLVRVGWVLKQWSHHMDSRVYACDDLNTWSRMPTCRQNHQGGENRELKSKRRKDEKMGREAPKSLLGVNYCAWSPCIILDSRILRFVFIFSRTLPNPPLHSYDLPCLISMWGSFSFYLCVSVASPTHYNLLSLLSGNNTEKEGERERGELAGNIYNIYAAEKERWVLWFLCKDIVLKYCRKQEKKKQKKEKVAVLRVTSICESAILYVPAFALSFSLALICQGPCNFRKVASFAVTHDSIVCG